MAHAQKTDFVFLRNGQVHLNRRGRQSTTGGRGARISGSNAGHTMFRGSVKSTGYPLHSPVSPSLPLPCVTVCHHISTGLYHQIRIQYFILFVHVACLICLQQCVTLSSPNWPPLIQTKSVFMSYYVAICNHQFTLFSNNFAIHNLQIKPSDDTDHSQYQAVCYWMISDRL